ncbi:unnamed protein product [Cuscuta campestris]|uniref:CCHC-type domain-containing protein n=1 Tax=Cuscuta campestris TaxID=132261 RepID=A0A484KYX4_9ASTE|nr:unnamed protein product [Cuscuta campestris]
MSQESIHGQYVPEPEHVSVHTVNTEGSSFTPPGDGGQQQNQPEPAGQPPAVPPPVVPPPVMPPLAIPQVAYEQMFPAMMAHYMQHMAQLMPMFQPPPPPQPQPRIVTFKTLKDNGAEEFRGDKMGEPQIALDWLEQMDRVLKNLRVPDADRSELASQMFRKGAYDWWKRIDQDPHTPKPWTWDRFDRAFMKEYVPTRYREERRDEFYATSLVSTPEDRLNEFVKKLRPDLRPYAALITTIDFNAAYDLIVKTEKSLDDLQATKKEDRATKHPRPAASTRPSGKSFGFGGKRYEKGSSSAPPPKRSKSRPSPSATASNSIRTRSHPQCVQCGRHHPGECWLAQGLCLGCGQPGHFRRHCPTNPSSEPVFPRAPDQPATSHPARSQQSIAANNQQRPRPQQLGRAPARTYAMQGRTDPSPDVILGTFILFDSVMHALIDPGSTLSYICVGMPANSAIVRSDLEIPTVVSNPLGHSMRLHHIYPRCPLSVQGKQFPADLIELPHKEFDIILGMDWLTEHRAVVDCSCRTVRLRAEDGTDVSLSGEVFPKAPEFISSLSARRLIRKKCEMFLCHVQDMRKESPRQQDIRTVCDFPDVFPEDLPGLPPPREVEFSINLIPAIAAASPSPEVRRPLPVPAPPIAAASFVGRPRHRAAAPLFRLRRSSAAVELQRCQSLPSAAVALSTAAILTVECSAATSSAGRRLPYQRPPSSPSSCRSATVAGVHHRRCIQPLPRIDIAGRLTSTPD